MRWNPGLAFLLAAMLAVATEPVAAQGFTTTGDQRFVVLGERRDRDVAIGIARAFDNTRLFRLRNGAFQVAVGPQAIRPTDAERRRLAQEFGYPASMSFSRGEAFAEEMPVPKRATPLAQAEIGPTPSDPEKIQPWPVTVRHGDLVVTLDAEKQGEEDRQPVVTGRIGDREVFRIVLDEGLGETPIAQVELHRLDDTSPYPQVVATTYTGGAHCCVVTFFASAAADGSWRVTKGATLDGADRGYEIEDLDGDGKLELVFLDNSFLYKFSSYASSFPPSRIVRFTEGALVDVTADPRFRARHRQALGTMEIRRPARGSGDGNGWLAGWVATRALLGEFEPAFAQARREQDRDSVPVMIGCRITPAEGESCPEEQERRAPFLQALRMHLEQRGYLARR